MPPFLLLTRPLPQARRFAREAAAALPPHEPIFAPLSQVVALPHDRGVFDGARGVILTSASAVPMLPPLPGLTAWCVGPATARAAARAGLVPRPGGGDAAALIDTLRREAPEGPLVHAHGVHLARDLVAALPGLSLRSVAVYEARACDWPDDVLPALAGQRVFAPLFSPRAAARLAAQSGVPDLAGLIPVAISAACAAALPGPLAARARIADTPDSGGMLRALAEAMSHPGTVG
ncbi:MAG TPA: uroporphyrinogen-III synthase [Pararhodobacter sp.]|uniref:uroporphyrinogen-III synthase n=1 Tax=Pararhodobacter sp. TaxID=2127056 RepID=UPI002BC8F125|nr:uroporphyrinogen-III synthase [Pararhodobacter sp.]HPD91536.1 uroporphyrinogen-III synthase [Pararhodobacter sp.]